MAKSIQNRAMDLIEKAAQLSSRTEMPLKLLSLKTCVDQQYLTKGQRKSGTENKYSSKGTLHEGPSKFIVETFARLGISDILDGWDGSEQTEDETRQKLKELLDAIPDCEREKATAAARSAPAGVPPVFARERASEAGWRHVTSTQSYPTEPASHPGMTRISKPWLWAIGLTACLGTCLAIAFFFRKPIVHWNATSPWDANSCHAVMIDDIAMEVAERTGGRFSIQVFHEGRLPGADTSATLHRLRELVTAGEKIQMLHSCPYYWHEALPVTAFLGSAPGGLSMEFLSVLMEEGGVDSSGIGVLQALYDSADWNLRVFACGYTGEQNGFWMRSRPEKLSDFLGKKIRIGGNLAQSVMDSVNGDAELAAIANYDLFRSMATDTALFAVEWTGLIDDSRLRLSELPQFEFVETDWHEPSTMLEMMVNKQAFDALPTAWQTLLADIFQQKKQWLYDALSAGEEKDNIRKKLGTHRYSKLAPDIERQLRLIANRKVEEYVRKHKSAPYMRYIYERYHQLCPLYRQDGDGDGDFDYECTACRCKDWVHADSIWGR